MSDSELKQVDPPKEHVLFEGMARVYDKTEADEYIEALREQIANLTLLSDSQLVGEMQELRQGMIGMTGGLAMAQAALERSDPFAAASLVRAMQQRADALLAAKDTPTEPKSAPEEQQ